MDKRYFNWMCRGVCVKERKLGYSKLMKALSETAFYWSISMDENRAMDGFSLRGKYVQETGNIIDNKEMPDYCSVLEMLVALSRRIEDDIMEDMNRGCHPENWFWIFMANTDLDQLTDDNWDKEDFNRKVSRWLSRKYTKFGDGNIVFVKKLRTSRIIGDDDLRNIDIWTQVHMYLNSLED